MKRQASSADQEAIVANAMQYLAHELRLLDLADYVAFIRLDSMATMADIVETAAELYFLPGVLKLGNGCECHVSWTGVPRIVLDLELRPKGVTVYFTLSLSADHAGIDVDYIAFDKPADDPELNSKLLRAALESARIHKTVAHCN